MRLGFSGTRRGMTPIQKLKLALLLVKLHPTEAHHGDCVGADADFHAIVRKFPFPVRIVGHPPVDPKHRAWCACDELRPEKPFLERNHAIVDAVDHLVITPKTGQQELRSGTWSTYRYAEKLDRPRTVIEP